MILRNGRDASRLPFSGYKWRWATLTPTESLNRPDLFVGVLRVLAQHVGRVPSDPAVISDLDALQTDVVSDVNLARSDDRNLLRNSGQYWKALGVLAATQPGIALTPLGLKYANREISQQDFGVRVVLDLELPSPAYSAADAAIWFQNGVRIRPLILILEIVAALASANREDGYITVEELIRVVQPLSGHRAHQSEIVGAILSYRDGTLDVSAWESVLTAPNDRRMAKEFLLFLVNYGFLIRSLETDVLGNQEGRYRLDPVAVDLVAEITAVVAAGPSASPAAAQQVVDAVERSRVLREVLNRPGQRRFRLEVLAAASNRCLLSGTSLVPVLEAAHIRPVAQRGSDSSGNGLALRSDIHSLFDRGSIRLRPDGVIDLSAQVSADSAYDEIPSSIVIPAYVDPVMVRWRWDYL